MMVTRDDQKHRYSFLGYLSEGFATQGKGRDGLIQKFQDNTQFFLLGLHQLDCPPHLNQ